MAEVVELDRIKRNVGRMIDQGAPESEVDAYVTSEGATPEMLRGSGASRPGTPPQATIAPGATPAPPISQGNTQIDWQQQDPSNPAADTSVAPARSGVRPMVGVQGAGRGVADVAGTLPDIANMGANALLALVDRGSRVAGGPEISYRFPMASDEIAKTAGGLASKIGVPVLDEADMTSKEKLSYNVNRFGTQGALSAGILTPIAAARATSAAARVVPKVGDTFVQPYVANAAKVGIGDTVAGAGAGTAITGSQALPDEIRKAGGGAVGGVADLLAMLAGGAGGGTIAGTAMNGPSYVRQRAMSSLPDRGIPIDPETKMPTSNRVSDATADFVQSQTTNPTTAADEILRGANDFRNMGAPVPTTGLLSKDPKLTALERGQRRTDPGTFDANDTALRDAARESVESIQPSGVDPRDATRFIQGEVDRRIGDAETNLRTATSREATAANAERSIADVVRQAGGRGSAASADLDRLLIDRSLRPMDETRRAAFDAVPRDVTVPGEPFVERAQTIRDSARHLPPNARTEVLPANRLQDLESFAQRNAEGEIESIDPVPFGTINDMRPIVSSEIARARAENLPPPYIENLEAIRRELNAATDELPEARAALDHFQNTYAPVWGRGSGPAYDFRQDFNVDRTNRIASPPTTTAGRFLTKSEGAREKAQALSRVVASMADPNDQRATNDAIRRYVLDDVSRTVGNDGRIDGQQLARWLNGKGGWGDALGEFPTVRAEMNQLLRDVQAGNTARNVMAAEVERASTNVRRTQEQIDNSALSLVIGREPRKAARTVLESRDPMMAMREVRSTIGANAKAAKAWERAVTDHLVDRVTRIAPGDVSSGTRALDYAKLVRTFDNYRPALAELYASQPDKMNALQRAQTLLEPLARVAGGASTAKPEVVGNEALWRALEIGLKSFFGVLEGGGRLRTLKIAVKGIGDDTAQIERLVARMMFDPELAAHLLTKKTTEVATPAWNDKLAKLLRRTEAGRSVWGDDNEEERPQK